MIMSTVGRGGEGDVGQRIRDEILVIQVNDKSFLLLLPPQFSVHLIISYFMEFSILIMQVIIDYRETMIAKVV